MTCSGSLAVNPQQYVDCCSLTAVYDLSVCFKRVFTPGSHDDGYLFKKLQSQTATALT